MSSTATRSPGRPLRGPGSAHREVMMIGDTGGDVDLHCLLGADPAFPLALRARLGDHAALAGTGGADEPGRAVRPLDDVSCVTRNPGRQPVRRHPAAKISVIDAAVMPASQVDGDVLFARF